MAKAAASAVISLFEGRARATLHWRRGPCACFGGSRIAGSSHLKRFAFKRRNDGRSLNWLRGAGMFGVLDMLSGRGMFGWLLS